MTDKSVKDQVFAKPLSQVKAFEFNEDVARVFRDMISRSVPGYELLLHLIGLYADVFAQQASNIYDLGCSLGEVTQLVAQATSGLDCSIIAVDNSAAMIKKCRRRYADTVSIDWQCKDIQEVEIHNASLVILNLTLQFIEQDRRQAMINKIYQGLNPGGVLVLSEKVLFDENLENERMVQLYQAFKKTRGYSDLEISQKRTALENVLVSDRETVHRQRLDGAGFSEIYQYFRAFNFVSYLAIK
ncbi:MAG: carboxy-S-adenosyl-L-methionine synthase CmoA [Gammaproteobacteria bacterium]|nr:carboxy-S-adenosyl-L-methionine synthase CmoA [Gammaproteobacteria bacterium]